MDYLLSKSYRNFDRITFHVSRSQRCNSAIASFTWHIFKTNLLKQLLWQRRTCFHLRSCSLRIERFNIIASSEFPLMQFDSIYIFGLYFVQVFVSLNTILKTCFQRREVTFFLQNSIKPIQTLTLVVKQQFRMIKFSMNRTGKWQL